MSHVATDRGWLSAGLIAVLVLLGVALRVAVAGNAAHAGLDWEADGFLRCWEAVGFVPASRMRPPLAPWLFHGLAELLSARSILAVRLLSIGLSLVGLLGALVLGRVLAVRFGGRVPGHCSVARWIVGLWAVQPTLLVGSASPTGDALLGGMVCLAVAAALVAGSGSGGGALRAAWLLLAVLGALLAGGIVVACAAVVALLVFLLPVPPWRVAIVPLAAIVLACLAGGWLQRGDGARPWMPDNAPAWSLTALVDARLLQDEREALDPDLRAQEVWTAAARGAAAIGATGVMAAAGDRLVGDLLNPARFEQVLDVPGARWSPGLLDLLLRGGLLALAIAAVARMRPAGPVQGWPRAGLLAGAAVLFVGLLLTASNPYALAPFDTLVVAVAGAGIACAEPGRRARRWLLFLAGGVLLASLGVVAVARGQPLSGWITTLYHEMNQGPAAVTVLADGGPSNESGEIFAANVFMDRTAPFLRMPEASLRHALRATQLAPDSARATNALVSAEIENLDFAEALRLASTLRDEEGRMTPSGEVLQKWVRQCERDWRTRQLR